MDKILRFDSYDDYRLFLKNNSCGKKIGEGGEGECILSRDGKYLYKVITKMDNCNSYIVDYNVNEIITTYDIDLTHYILPSELHAVGNRMVGCKVRYIKGEDLFSAINLNRMYEERGLINFEALLESYYEMEKETDLLSKEKISLYDLTYNVMFIKNNLYGIDTCGYKRGNEDIFKANRDALEEAIRDMFDEWLMYDDYVKESTRLALYDEKNMRKYVKSLSKIVHRH